MCVIAVYSDNYPKLVDLESMEAFNSDGAGIAWIDRKTNKVEWVKGLKLSAKKIHKMITKKKIQLPFVIHFRISSVGKTNNELCHPFTLEKNDSKVLELLDIFIMTLIRILYQILCMIILMLLLCLIHKLNLRKL